MKNAQSIFYNKKIISNKKLIAATGVIFFVLATMLGAYVRVPLVGTPVPVTLQTFFAILAGAVLGKRLGALSQVCYAVLSAPLLLGPTGGYFIGFIAASYIVGYMTESCKSGAGWAIFSFAAGSVVIYTFGVAWLSCLLKIGIVKAVYMGALPFIPGDIVKILAAAVVYSGISRRSKEIFSE